MMDYKEFLKSKKVKVEPAGFIVDEKDLNQSMFDWQRAICRWAKATTTRPSAPFRWNLLLAVKT